MLIENLKTLLYLIKYPYNFSAFFSVLKIKFGRDFLLKSENNFFRFLGLFFK